MKTHDTIAGSYYGITSPNGCTVTDEYGALKKPIEAGDQLTIQAPGAQLIVDDDEAIVRKSLFNRAALALGLLGGGVKSELPAGYLRAEFLERANTAYHNQSIVLPAWFNPSVDTVRIETMHAGYRKDWLSVEGSYCNLGFGYGYYTNATALYMSGEKWGYKKTTSDIADLRYHAFVIESTPSVHSFFLDGEKYYEGNEDLSALEGFKFSLFEAHNDGRVFLGKKKYWNLDVNGKAVARLLPVLDVAGVPCMLNTVDKGAHYPETAVNFIVGFTLKQANKLGKHLPEGGGSLTVSLPCEAQLVQYNADVEASLQTAKGKGWTITVQYREPEEDSVLNTKYAECKDGFQLKEVNPDYMKDLTANGEWKWQLPVFVGGGMPFYFGSVKVWLVDLPKMINGANMFYQNIQLTRFKGALPVLSSGWAMFFGDRNMTSFESEVPALSEGANMFGNTKLDKVSALRVLVSIPAYTSGTHKLTLGVHVDHQSDDEVIAAIEAAEAKGWTMEVQWNGTATAAAASTYGLRRKPVYAKLGEPMEDGKQHLDWGHYVTNWEENGYLEFSSLEEAKEHFNIGD